MSPCSRSCEDGSLCSHILGTPGQLPGDMSSCFLILLYGYPLLGLAVAVIPSPGHMRVPPPLSPCDYMSTCGHPGMAALRSQTRAEWECVRKDSKLLTEVTPWIFLPGKQTLTLEMIPIRDRVASGVTSVRSSGDVGHTARCRQHFHRGTGGGCCILGCTGHIGKRSSCLWPNAW